MFPRSHTLSVLSSEAETAGFPSAVTATPLTNEEWPSRVRSSRLLSRSHTFGVERIKFHHWDTSRAMQRT